jgi:hypothetical protein
VLAAAAPTHGGDAAVRLAGDEVEAGIDRTGLGASVSHMTQTNRIRTGLYCS